MMQGGISLGMSKVQLLLDKHENANGVRMKTSTPEGDCVATTWEDPLNSDSRTWRYVWKSDLYETDNSPGIHKMSQAMQKRFGNWACRPNYQWIGLHALKSSAGSLKYSSSSLTEVFSFLWYRAVKDFWGKPAVMGGDWIDVDGDDDSTRMMFA